MRAIKFCALFVAASVIGISPLLAQAKKDVKAPASGPETRYFTSLSGLMGDQADVILKETRQGGRVTAAMLDVCFPASTASTRMDRFVVDLAVDGAKLSGRTQSLEDKLPIAVDLTRKANGKAFDFTGTVTVGATPSEVASADNTDVSEKEFKESQIFEEKIVAAPADFSDVSPESVAVKVKRDALVDYVKSLKGQNLQVALSSLTASCTEMRAGAQVVRITVDPDRAVELIAKAKTSPGVIVAGFTDGAFDMERTLRVPAAGWREGGKLDRDKLATRLSDVMAKTLSAKPLAAKWNDETGELTLTFKRPSQLLPALELTETISATAMASSDRPGPSDHLMVWVGTPTIETADESAGPKLRLTDSSGGSSDEDGGSADDNGVLDALAGDLKAQRWDADRSVWK